MVRTNPSLIGNNLWCIFFHNPQLPVHCRRQLEFHLKTIFHSIDNISDSLTLSNAMQRQFIVDKLVFIVSGDKAKAVCGLVNSRKDKLKNPLIYELQFGQDSLKSNLTQDKKFLSIERLFNKIVIDTKTCIEIPTQSCLDASDDDDDDDDDDETLCEKSTLQFGIHEIVRTQQTFCYLKRESLKFVLFQVFINMVLEINLDDDAVRKMWRHCRQDSTNVRRKSYLEQIDDFETRYTPESVIRLYTRNGFLFRYINNALRCENIGKIFAFRPFLKHLHARLDELGTMQRRDGINPLFVYRGKKLPKSTLQLLQNNINNLISINGLLSTTVSNNVADMFADNTNPRADYESAIIEMWVGETQLDQIMAINRPFACISSESEYPHEDEVLFFVGFVWLIQSVQKDNENIWKIKLQLSTDMIPPVTDKMNDVKDKYNYFTLGRILHELGEYTDAINFYDRMIQSCSDLSSRDLGVIHFHIAKSACTHGLFPVARDHLKKAEEYLKNQTTENDERSIDLQVIYAEDADLSPMSITNNMGLVYQAMDEFTNAQRLFNEALTEDGSTNDTAHVYYCIGVLKFCDGMYQEAHDNYSQALLLVADAKLREEINQRLSTVNQRLAPR